MALPQPDPSLPNLPVPLFSDIDAARGDHLRANNQKIWENLQYLLDGVPGWVRDTLLTGYAVGSNVALAATDTVLVAFGKIQSQLNATNARIGAWAAYTPTFAGFGTVANVQCFWRLIGDSVEIRGYFESGTPTATVAEISLPNGYTSEPTKLSSVIDAAGIFLQESAGAVSLYTLIQPSSTVINVSSQSAAFGARGIRNGNDVVPPGSACMFTALVPVS